MDLFSLIVMTVVGVILASVANWALSLSERLAVMQRLYEEAIAWSEKYQVDAADLRHQLAELQQDYAVLLWLHDGTTMLEQSAAWRAGLRERK